MVGICPSQDREQCEEWRGDELRLFCKMLETGGCHVRRDEMLGAMLGLNRVPGTAG
jgi:hypothetical protein